MQPDIVYLLLSTPSAIRDLVAKLGSLSDSSPTP